MGTLGPQREKTNFPVCASPPIDWQLLGPPSARRLPPPVLGPRRAEQQSSGPPPRGLLAVGLLYYTSKGEGVSPSQLKLHCSAP